MPDLVKVKLPPGLSRSGTIYETMGRWYDANFVRWYEGNFGTIGGWTARTTSAMTGMARAIVAWRSNSNVRYIAVGTHSKLYALTPSTVAPVDITPVGFTAGNASATTGGGYGVGAYGAGAYGTPRTDTSVVVDASMWTLDVFGQYLVGVMSDDGKAYEWQLDIGSPTKAAAISGAPTSNEACVVTPESFLMLLGAGGDKRKVQWCDRGDNTVWTPSSTNLAGDFNIQTNGRLMCGKRIRGQTILFTDLDCHIASYVGLPDVYSIDRVGENCGIISRGAAVSSDSRCMWMGQNGFYAFDGSGVVPIPCEISDAVFGNMNVTQRSKVVATLNSAFSEAWWAFPSANSTENDMIAVFNYDENHWNLHTLARTCMMDKGVFVNPIMGGTTGYLYDHETGSTWDGTKPYAKSGPAELGKGDRLTRVRRVIFDERTEGDVQASFLTRNWPTDSETTYGPYTSGNPVSVRFSGRQVRLSVEFQTSGRWGTPRFDVVEGSRR